MKPYHWRVRRQPQQSVQSAASTKKPRKYKNTLMLGTLFPAKKTGTCMMEYGPSGRKRKKKRRKQTLKDNSQILSYQTKLEKPIIDITTNQFHQQLIDLRSQLAK